MVRILDADEVRSTLDLASLLSVVETAFERQRSGHVERPTRPHFPVGLDPGQTPGEAAGIGLAMPAYIHGENHFATKLVSVHEGNPERDLPTIHAQVVVADAETGVPRAFMDGGYVTAARTSCIGGLSARELTDGPVRVGVIGSGTQGQWQVRAIAEVTQVESVSFFDIDPDAAEAARDNLSGEIDATIRVGENPATVVESSNLVVTATTSPEPVFSGDVLEPGTVVVAIGAYTPEMQEIDARTFERAARVFADVPEEVVEIGDISVAGLSEAELVPFAEMLHGDMGRESDDEILIVESVGSATMDAAAAGHIFEQAVEHDIGTEVEL